MEQIGTNISATVVEFIAQHPALIGWLVVTFLTATVLVNAIKWTWPDYATMPKGARFALGLLMPLALNFWTLAKKIGVQEPVPPPGAKAPAP